jgi:3-deoxy-D-arabino-heptulosonate 7-phosphate (DAHP) synthase
MIEVHDDPEEALVDASQMITPEALAKVIKACNNIYDLLASEKAGK